MEYCSNKVCTNRNLNAMVHHPRRAAYEEGSPKFWLLFFLGLVIVLVLFRAFTAAVEGMGGFRSRGGVESRVGAREKRLGDKRIQPSRKGPRKSKADGHLD